MLVRFASLAVVGVLWACVSGPRPVTAARLATLSERRYVTQFDEAYDASWLSLERLGYVIEASDRQAGTFVARAKDGRTYSVSVSEHGESQVVTAVPGPERDAWQLDGAGGEIERWDQLEAMTKELVETWKNPPEWTFRPATSDVIIDSFHASVPLDWRHIDLAVDRRQVVAQRAKPPVEGLNPTLAIRVERRRPMHPRAEPIRAVASLALGISSHPVTTTPLTSELTELGFGGDTTVLLENSERHVRWHLWDARSRAWTVRLVAVCGPADSPDSCEGEWRRVITQLRSTGFEFPRDE
jgi:hypothetical protein